DLPDELLYGRVGFLWACLFLNKHLGQGTVPSNYTATIVNEIIKNGRALGRKGKCPLMFEWYGEKYWGAAHGLAGIMHVLMDMELKPDELEDVRETLKYMTRNCFRSGNYPVSEEDKKRDVLVHWCHGAPGVALTLVKAAKLLKQERWFGVAVCSSELGFAMVLVGMHMSSCHFTNLPGTRSIYTEPKLLHAFYLIELII
ncbi:lanC-like protein 2-like, partial [Trifolium medium]|nr:lanC-like protein 2-like [Trifolium medium]